MKPFLLPLLLLCTLTIQAQYSRPPADSILDLHYNKLLPIAAYTTKPQIQWIPDEAMSPETRLAKKRYMRVRWMSDAGAIMTTASLMLAFGFIGEDAKYATRNTIITLASGLVAGITLPILPRKRYNKMRDSYNPEALKYYGFR